MKFVFDKNGISWGTEEFDILNNFLQNFVWKFPNNAKTENETWTEHINCLRTPSSFLVNQTIQAGDDVSSEKKIYFVTHSPSFQNIRKIHFFIPSK